MPSEEGPAPDYPSTCLTRRHALAALGTLAGASLLSGRSVQAADSPNPPGPSPRAPITGYLMRYRLGEGSENWPADKRQAIVDAMDGAVGLYNQLGQFPKEVTAWYSPGTPTADGSYNGTIRFGGQIGFRVALHELGHVVGGGTHPNWGKYAVNGRWTGPHALAQLRAFDGPDAVLGCDRMHFWPYGLNYDNEGSPENFRRHVLMLAALRRDMGISTGKPFRGLVGVGTWDTQAEFRNFQVMRGQQALFRTGPADQDLGRWQTLRGQWKMTDGTLRQTGPEQGAIALVGDRGWSNYTVTVEARKTGGKEGFLVAFGWQNEDAKSWWNVGGFDNTRSTVQAPDTESGLVDTRIETGRWYTLRLEVAGSTVRCYLDGKLVQEGTR